jgi:hypothetical protein
MLLLGVEAVLRLLPWGRGVSCDCCCGGGVTCIMVRSNPSVIDVTYLGFPEHMGRSQDMSVRISAEFDLGKAVSRQKYIILTSNLIICNLISQHYA